MFSLFISLLMSILLSASHSSGPIKPAADGYLIDLGEDILDPVAAKNVRVDVALVDFSDLRRARTEKDSISILERIYRDPTKFSIVTGSLQYVNASTAKLVTKARFKFRLEDTRYKMVIVENDGGENSGTNVAPQAFTQRSKGKCRCKACGCCCYRKADGNCVYCGIIIKLTN